MGTCTIKFSIAIVSGDTEQNHLITTAVCFFIFDHVTKSKLKTI